MVSAQPSLQQSAKPHLHVQGEQCPLCEQPIPQEKSKEITERIAAKERRQQAEIDARILREKAEAEAKAKLEIETVRQQGLAAVEAAKAEAATREATAREEGKRVAEAALQATLAEAQEATKTANELGASMTAQLEQSRAQYTAVIQKMTSEFAAREASLREEAKKSAEATVQVKLSEAEKKLAELKASQEAVLNQRLQEQRQAIEKASTKAVNAEKARAFEKEAKLEAKLQEVTRQLQNKTAEELGEGAEVDLFEQLKAEFPDDTITRVGKGNAGADIIHEIFNNGKLCGRIVYDSKNRTAWRNEYVTKLRQDQTAAKADHGILSSLAFPSGTRQLHTQNGVIIVNPARALVIATVLRKHVVHTHGLRISNEARAQKTEALYAFITSERCNQFLDTISSSTEDMEELDVKEKRAHDATWRKRGELIRTVQRSRGQLCDDIERIIGTAGE